MSKKNYILSLILIVCIFIIQAMPIYAENIQQINYSLPSQIYSNPNFMITVLKYEPFPVNAGDWFDLWIKVQNIGQNDAPDARFTLIPEYPFYSNDSLVRNYGKIYGTANAYKINQDTDSSQIILKYRVQVLNNAPAGVSNLKFSLSTNAFNPDSLTIIEDLPIEIAKTKTDFDVKLKTISSQESSFIVSNIGENMAKAIRVDIKKEDGIIFLSNFEPGSIGDLDIGEFTIAHMKAVPQKNNVTLEISYTDTSGVRTSLEKTISMSQSALADICIVDTSKNYLKWVFGLIGLITGIFVVVLLGLIKHKKHAAKQISH